MVNKDCDDKPCFFCMKPVKKGVQWDEGNNWRDNPSGDGLIHLILCPECAVKLGERLIGDGFEADKNVQKPETVLMLVKSRMNYRKK
jgi:hypothetical protein